MTSLPTNLSKGASPDRDAESRDALECLASMLFDGGRRTRMIGICAEPGMGRRSLITRLVLLPRKRASGSIVMTCLQGIQSPRPRLSFGWPVSPRVAPSRAWSHLTSFLPLTRHAFGARHVR